MKEIEVKVLPAPVVFWFWVCGWFFFCDFSRLLIAVIWAGLWPSSLSGGMACRRARKVAGASFAVAEFPSPPAPLPLAGEGRKASHSASSLGWWKANTARERGVGSRPLVKRVSMAVDWLE